MASSIDEDERDAAHRGFAGAFPLFFLKRGVRE